MRISAHSAGRSLLLVLDLVFPSVLRVGDDIAINAPLRLVLLVSLFVFPILARLGDHFVSN